MQGRRRILAGAAALTAAITFAATALIVPGTGTHNIETVMGYKENAADRFNGPATVATPFFCTWPRVLKQ